MGYRAVSPDKGIQHLGYISLQYSPASGPDIFPTSYTLLQSCREFVVMHVFNLIVPALIFLGGAAGLPSGQYSDYELEFREKHLASNSVGLTSRQNVKPALRILPLGASIVSGVGSSTMNG